MAFNVFIGWAGKKGRSLAPHLATWIEEFFEEGVQAKTTDLNLYPGQDFTQAVESQLSRNADATILCLSNDGLDSKWIHYEAGTAGSALITPLLVGIDKEDETFKEKWTGPLENRLVANAADPEDIRQMMKGINIKLKRPYPTKKEGTSPSVFDSEFDTKFPKLKAHIEKIINSPEETEGGRNAGISDTNEEQPTIWENRIIGIMHRIGIQEKGYRTDGVSIRTSMSKAGFSEGEYKLAMLLLQQKGYIAKVHLCSPVSYELTKKGLNWIASNIQEFVHESNWC